MRKDWHPSAENELNDIASYYREQDRPGLAIAFLDEARRVVDLVSQQPDGGRPLRDGVRAWRLRKFPYAVIYRVRTDRIRVLAVAGDRQRPYYWSRRA